MEAPQSVRLRGVTLLCFVIALFREYGKKNKANLRFPTGLMVVGCEFKFSKKVTKRSSMDAWKNNSFLTQDWKMAWCLR